jgi:hypothetical protein
MSTAPASKYRPYLSLPAMERILSLLPSNAESPIDYEIRIALQPMLLKASFGLAKPAHTPSSIRIGENLGMDSKDTEPTVRLEKLWLTYVAIPHTLTPAQIVEAKDYAYANAMMNPMQMAEYEAEMMNSISSNPSVTPNT